MRFLKNKFNYLFKLIIVTFAFLLSLYPFSGVLALSSQNEHNFFDMAGKIIDGCNENEVVFVNKSRKNRGFFERFFDLFS